MNCQRSEELWSDYLESALPPPLVRELESHWSDCDACRSLFESFDEVVKGLSAFQPEAPPAELRERIMERIRSQLRAPGMGPGPGASIFHLRSWTDAAGWAAAAALLTFLVFRPPEVVSSAGRKVSQTAHQLYSLGVRTYHDSERWVDEFNVLRMTVGVAFEDRLDRLNERLRDLEDARRKTPSDEPDNFDDLDRLDRPEQSSQSRPPTQTAGWIRRPEAGLRAPERAASERMKRYPALVECLKRSLL